MKAAYLIVALTVFSETETKTFAEDSSHISPFEHLRSQKLDAYIESVDMEDGSVDLESGPKLIRYIVHLKKLPNKAFLVIYTDKTEIIGGIPLISSQDMKWEFTLSEPLSQRCSLVFDDRVVPHVALEIRIPEMLSRYPKK